jgi:uncharacterized protein (TIGR02231 family)
MSGGLAGAVVGLAGLGRARRARAGGVAGLGRAGSTGAAGGVPVARQNGDMDLTDAQITAVTVFTDGARVHREGTARLEPGTATVTFTGLPGHLDHSSVRVSARGEGLTLTGVEVRRDFQADPLREQAARLRDEVDRLHDLLRELDDADAAQHAGLAFLGHVSEAAATALSRAIGAGRMEAGALDEMTGHLAASTTVILAARRETGTRRRAAQRDLDAAERQLATAEQAKPPSASTVTATVHAGQAGEATVEVSYHVPGASWRPLYDVVLTDGEVALTYRAEVSQQTGEDWPRASLTLSTTRRGSRRTLPELPAWYISKQPSRSEAWIGSGPAAGGMRPRALAAAAAPEAPAMVENTGESVVYRVTDPVTVPADGSPHATTIGQLELSAKLDHLTVPVVAPEAYLRATVVNSSELLLLAGQARVFRGGSYSGTTDLPVVAPGEEFELHLGVDDQVRVERELRRRHTSKAMLTGTRTVDIGYEITVANHRTDSARVQVTDHIPVSEDGDVKVRLREASPAPAGQDDLGELTWNLTLAAGQSAAVRYRFTVEHPADATVAGL